MNDIAPTSPPSTRPMKIDALEAAAGIEGDRNRLHS
jgi:hypothetical protein